MKNEGVASTFLNILKLAALGVTITLLLAACSPSDGGPGTRQNRGEVVVFAAASLTEPFEEIGRLIEEEDPGLNVTFSFGGSQQLRSQLEQGARADLFASASFEEMARARSADLVEEPRVFAHNELVVIVPRGNSIQVAALQDLARPGLKLDVAHRGVPVGAYTLSVLDKMSADPAFGPDFKGRVLANVKSEEDNVKKVVTKVLLGEADAGIVYSSDVTPDVKSKTQSIAIPGRFNVFADYPIARLGEARHRAEAQAFVDFLLSARGQAVLAKHGFIPEGKGVE